MADKKKRARGAATALSTSPTALLTLLVIGLVVAGGVVIWGAQQFYADGPTPRTRRSSSRRATGFGTIGSRLAEQRLIDNSLIFRAGAWVMQERRDGAAGRVHRSRRARAWPTSSRSSPRTSRSSTSSTFRRARAPSRSRSGSTTRPEAERRSGVGSRRRLGPAGAARLLPARHARERPQGDAGRR